MRKSLAVLLIFICYLNLVSNAQSVPVGALGLEDYYRRSQLAGRLDSTVSFTIRPLIPALAFNTKAIAYPDVAEERYNLLNANATGVSKDGQLKWQLLPMSVMLQANSHHPYGWNDGAMMPAKGLQTLLTAGIFAEYGPLSIQFKPEVV
ncbi:MAG: hypothetical protein EOO95_02115, partial [Pedobacter sp.]